MGKWKDQETVKCLSWRNGLQEGAKSKRDPCKDNQEEDLFGQECRHDQHQQRDHQVRGPVGNRLGVDGEKLMEQAVVVKDQLVDDIRITKMRRSVHAGEKPGCHKGQQVYQRNRCKDQQFGPLPSDGILHIP